MNLFKNDKKVEISVFQTELTRLQGLVQIIDSKLAFVFVVYSIIFWFYFNNLSKIKSLMYNCLDFVLILVIFILIVYWFFKIYWTIFPQVNKNDKPILFFWYIASLKLNDYKNQILWISEKKFMDEIIEQNHTLSSIIDKKIKNLKEVINVLILLIIISTIYLSINFEIFLWK